jgi:spore coat polysaccharide biosynthesis predicted glycosyltransferase SpsG
MAEREIQAVILTEAGGTRGNGHVARCTGLLEAFHQSGCRAQMWVDTDQPLPDWIDAGASIVVGDWKKDLDRYFPASGSPHIVVVVDSYEVDRPLLEAIAARSRSCCFFDDFARLDYPDGILVNAAFDADSLYPVRREGLQYLTGPRYAVLRKAFWQKHPYTIRDRIERAFVSLGSAVTAANALEVAICLKNNLSEAEITILHQNASALVDIHRKDGIRWAWESESGRLIALALRSDLAVCAGGQVLVEMACLGVPAISFLTADNQKANIAGFHKCGFSIDAGPLEEEDALKRLRASVVELMPASARAARSRSGRKLIDGFGAVRVVKILLPGD